METQINNLIKQKSILKKEIVAIENKIKELTK